MSQIRNVPMDMPIEHHMLLQEIRTALIKLQASGMPPDRPTNLQGVPGPGSINVVFTPAVGADKHYIMVSPTPKFDPGVPGNFIVDVGLSSAWTHHSGRPGQKFYYWIIASRGGVRSDPPTGPLAATTLALAAGAGPLPTAPPPNIARSDENVRPVIVLTDTEGRKDGL